VTTAGSAPPHPQLRLRLCDGLHTAFDTQKDRNAYWAGYCSSR